MVQICSTGAIIHNGGTIGLINYHNNILTKIEIDKKYHGNGYGTDTIKTFINDCKIEGYDECYIIAVSNIKIVNIIQNFTYEIVNSESIPSSHDMLKSQHPHYKIIIE